MPEPGRPEDLRSVEFAKPASLKLTFADGYEVVLSIARLEMLEGRIRWNTVRVTDHGKTMTVSGVPGDEIPIAVSTLRCLADPEYAAKVKTKRKKVRLSRDELRELARTNSPPVEWYEEPVQNLIRDSWK